MAKGTDYRWVILAVAIGAMASYSILYFGLSSLGPAISSDLGLNEGQLGIVLAAPLGGMAVGVLGWGALVDRHGERVPLALGLAGAGIAVLAASFSEDAVELGVLLGVSGLFGGASLYGLRAISAWFPPPHRGIAVSSGQASIMVGAALGAAVLPSLADDLPLDEAFVLIAALCLAAAAGCATLLRPNADEARRAREAGPPPSRWSVLRDHRIATVSLAGALVQLPSVALLSFAPLLLVQESGQSPAAAGAVLSVALVMTAAMRPLAGWIADASPGPILTMTAFSAAATLALLGLSLATATIDVVAAVMIVVALMLGMAGNGVSAATVAGLAPPGMAGAALSIRLLSYMIANTIGPIVLGVLISSFDAYAPALALLAVPALASTVLFASMARRVRR